MSLYFEERIKEEIKDLPPYEIIRFCFPWIVSIPPDSPETFEISRTLRTTFNINSLKWKVTVTNNNVKVEPENSWLVFSLCNSCYFSYKLYSDIEMRSEIYSSPRISMEENPRSCFVTPDDVMEEFAIAYEERKIAKLEMFVELELSETCFSLYKDYSFLECCCCEVYPEDMDSDFRFEFLKDGDFTFKCPDGDVKADKMVLNITSSFMKKQFKLSTSEEFIVDHAVDVVQPIMIYFHSGCFEMPTTYTLDFADRLIKAIQFFGLNDERRFLKETYYLSLCEKFVKDPHDFELILQWASLVSRHQHSIPTVYQIVSATIALNYYYKWIERFPENTGISENQFFGEIFRDVTNIFAESLSTKAILAICKCYDCVNIE